MNNKHVRTMAAIFADPVRASIVWADVEAMLIAIGCTVIEGNGSPVRFSKAGIIAAFHHPNPTKEAKRHHVRDACEFLRKIGVEP